MRPLGRGTRCPLDVEKRWIDGVRCSVLQLMFSFTNEGANHRESETHLLCLLATSLRLAFTFLALLLLPAPLLFGLSCFPLLLLLEPFEVASSDVLCGAAIDGWNFERLSFVSNLCLESIHV